MSHQSLLRRIARQAMSARGLSPDFSPQAARQAMLIAGPAAPTLPGSRDLRELLWASIDNDDSRDLDQLSVAQSLSSGDTRVLVAIADVDALVPRGCPIDDHASTNTTSVYTVAEVFPMLPLKLSTGLTSLAPDEDRVALVIEMTVAADGVLRDSDVYPALVRNRAKLAYSALGPWLAGRGPAPPSVAAIAGLEQQLRLQDRAAQALRSVRQTRGALSLESVETGAVFEHDMLVDLRPLPKNRAHELIEDFMIAANGVTARFLAGRGARSLRRVLPVPKKWGRIVGLASQLGETLPAIPSAAALSAFLARRRRADAASFVDLSLCVIKLLGRGEYALDLPGESGVGHFGLAVSDYTHSTAPNRRFPDLVTQRLLKSCLFGGGMAYAAEQLRALAEHCTLQEDNVAKVERRVAKSAAALLLSSQIGRRFDAIVTGAADKGTWVRIVSPAIEGRLLRGFTDMDVGDRLTVRLLRTDVERGFIDFERVR